MFKSKRRDASPAESENEQGPGSLSENEYDFSQIDWGTFEDPETTRARIHEADMVLQGVFNDALAIARHHRIGVGMAATAMLESGVSFERVMTQFATAATVDGVTVAVLDDHRPWDFTWIEPAILCGCAITCRQGDETSIFTLAVAVHGTIRFVSATDDGQSIHAASSYPVRDIGDFFERLVVEVAELQRRRLDEPMRSERERMERLGRFGDLVKWLPGIL